MKLILNEISELIVAKKSLLRPDRHTWVKQYTTFPLGIINYLLYSFYHSLVVFNLGLPNDPSLNIHMKLNTDLSDKALRV